MTTPLERWQADLAAAPNRPQPPTTVSGVPIDPLYTPENLGGAVDLGYPGQYPFARGVHASLYRSRLWTMRQFAGLAPPGKPTNASSFSSARVKPD